MAKTSEVEAPVINIIGVGTVIKGDITTNGKIRIDGTLEGNLVSTGDLLVGQTGKIDGTVKCKNADISGELKVNMDVAEKLILTASANIQGDVVANKLAIEPGALFSGNCKMHKNTKA